MHISVVGHRFAPRKQDWDAIAKFFWYALIGSVVVVIVGALLAEVPWNTVWAATVTFATTAASAILEMPGWGWICLSILWVGAGIKERLQSIQYVLGGLPRNNEEWMDE